MATIVNKLEHTITKEVPKIFDAVFECTLVMINRDFEDFPEHRKNFFMLLQAVNQHCFPGRCLNFIIHFKNKHLFYFTLFSALIQIPGPQFKLVLDSIIWAFKHTMRDVAEIGLEILLKLLQNIREHEEAAQGFYQAYYIEIMQHVFAVVTDTSHIAGLTFHSQILAHMFALLESNKINVPLGPQVSNPSQNIEFVQQHVFSLMKGAYPHLQEYVFR
jgi:exportin-1